MAKKTKMKGKAPKGRASQKKKAQKGPAGASGGGWQRRVLLDQDGDDEGDDWHAGRAFRGFAQSGPPAFSSPNPAIKLRHQTITFVSAGTNRTLHDRPSRQTNSDLVVDFETETAVQYDDADEDRGEEEVEEEEDEEEDGEGEEYEERNRDREVDEQSEVEIKKDKCVNNIIQNKLIVEPRVEDSESAMASMDLNDRGADAPLFIVDRVGDPRLGSDTTKAKHPSSRDTAHDSSDSESDVVVFTGRRGKPSVIDDPIPTKPDHKTDPVVHTDEPPAWDLYCEKAVWPEASSGIGGLDSKPSLFARGLNPNERWAPTAGSGFRSKGKSPAPLTESKSAGDNIATLQADWKQVLKERKEARQSHQQADVVKLDGSRSNRRGKRGRKKSNHQLREALDSDEDDHILEAAYDDYMQNLAREAENSETGEPTGQGFAAINLSGGPSLVVDGQELRDDELLDEEFTRNVEQYSNSSESTRIGQDLSELSGDSEFLASHMNSSELEEELEYTEAQQWEDEEDLRQRRQDGMADEELARIFAKQEQFGIYGDNVVIDDGKFIVGGAEGVGDVEAARAGLAKMTNFDLGRTGHKGSVRRRSKRGKGEPAFVDASMLADTIDQYGEHGFDIMDFDRPSLRSTKKGQKGKAPPALDDLSDEDLRNVMMATWDNDRIKKRQKKAEREELRAQGLLGPDGKNGKPDLAQKYSHGITTTQIHEELRAFIDDDDLTSKPFPPMDKKDRKDLHEIASVLKLKSKSVGSGNNRYPVLYKMKATNYSADLLERAITASSRGALGRGGKFARRSLQKPGRAGAGGGFNKAAVSLRNGEVVGAGAAEIGKENFGHRMMEKMGWSKGQALGKDGEGRLIPVEQVMRAGRAGLG